jgi:deazaflavin-dependent oxidoreductase (nitroreductase family)
MFPRASHRASVGQRVRKFLQFRVLPWPFVALGRTRGIRLVAPWVRAIDGFLYRRYGGRVTSVGLAGLPSLILHVRGRRSGREYLVPLLCLPWGKGFVVVGSNWGRPEHPNWTTNLMAESSVEVNYRGRVETVSSRQLQEFERELVWPHLVKSWPGYRSYAKRVDRTLRMFLLDPVAEVAASQSETAHDAISPLRVGGVDARTSGSFQ